MSTALRSPNQLQSPGGWSWFVSGLGLGQICSWGALYYSFPLIAEAMRRDLGWSKSHLYGAATLGLLIAAAAAYPVGKAIDRGHGRLIMSAGALAAGILFLAWSAVQSLAFFVVIAAGLGALQAALLYEPAFAVAAQRIGGGARGAIAALTLWGGFASTIFVPLVQLLLDGFGWRGALLGLGVINIGCAWLYWTIIGPPAEAATQRTASLAPVRPLPESLRSPVFWALTLAFTAHAGAATVFTFHLYPLLLERGFSASQIVIAMTAIGPAQVVSRVVMTVFARGASVRRIGSFVVVGFPLAFTALALAPPSLVAIAAIAALYGAANGALTIVRGLAAPEMISPHDYGAINGAMNTPVTFAKALAPLGAAALWQANQSYELAIGAVIGGALLLVVSFWAAAWISSRSGGRR